MCEQCSLSTHDNSAHVNVCSAPLVLIGMHVDVCHSILYEIALHRTPRMCCAEWNRKYKIVKQKIIIVCTPANRHYKHF